MAISSRSRLPGGRTTAVFLWTVLLCEALAIWWLRRPWMSPDSALYLELAANLSDAGFASQAPGGLEPDALRAPGYPVLLNLLLVRIGLSAGTVVGLQMGLYLGSIWLIAYRVISTGPLRLVFLAAVVVYVFPFFYAATLLTEAVSIFLITSLVAIVTSRWRRPVFQWSLAGAVAGIGTLVRTDLAPALGAVLIILAWRNRDYWRTAARFALVTVGAAAIVTLPYMTWNKATFGRFSPVPVASTVGHSLYIASWEGKVELEDLLIVSGFPPTAHAMDTGLAPEVHRILAGARTDAVKLPFPNEYPKRRLEIATSSAYAQAALRRIRDDPGHFIRHMANATWRLLNTSEYPALPLPVELGLKLISYAATAGGVLGAAMTFASPQLASRTPAMFWAAHHIPHLPLHTEARYTAPIRLLLLYYAAVAFLVLGKRLAARLSAKRATFARP